MARLPHAGQALIDLGSKFDEERRKTTTMAPSPTKKSIINTATRGDEDKQRIATPWAFIHALEQRFGTPVDFDLAAEEHNNKALGDYWSSDIDALKQDWSDIWKRHPAGDLVPVRLAYLNPPFAHIKPWAREVAKCRWLPRWTVMLVPASYSTDWFLELAEEVQRCAIPRMQFEGNDKVYPKDLALIVAGFGICGDGYWDWRVSYLQWCAVRGVSPDPVHARGCSALLKAGSALGCLPDYLNSLDPFAEPHAP